MSLIQFVRNYNDESTERGFQFEFYCDRCSNGYRTPFQSSTSGLVSEALDAAGGFLGGLFGAAADVGDRVHSAAWEKAHDQAFTKAVEQARPHFVRCPRCSQWVCREACWNTGRGLCKECAPEQEVEFAAAQAEAIVEQAREALAESALLSKEDRARLAGDTLVASCPGCGASLSSPAKFCPECGAPLRVEKHCTNCGHKIPAGVKFCPECGTKQ